MAYKDGKLSGRRQTRIQRWALGYALFMEKRDHSDEKFEIVKLLHYLLRAQNARFYEDVFPQAVPADPDALPGQTYTVDELEDMEKRVMEIASKRTVSQSKLDKTEWTDWG